MAKRKPRRADGATTEAASPLIDLQPHSTISVLATRKMFNAAGLTTLPLIPGGKSCVIKGWTTMPSSDLWEEAEDDANIGLRCGDGGLGALDPDDERANRAIASWHKGMGIDPVGVVTRPDRMQYYLLTEFPEGFHRGTLTDLNGDALGPHSLSCTAPSRVNGFQRYLVGDIGQLTYVQFRDLPVTWAAQHKLTIPAELEGRLAELGLYGLGLRATRANTNTLDCVRLFGFSEQWIEEAGRLASRLHATKPGHPVQLESGAYYPSRSEAIWSITRTLLKVDWDIEKICEFIGHVPGRMVDIEDDVRRCQATLISERMPLIEQLEQLPETLDTSRHATGRATDGKVMSGLLRLAIQFGPEFGHETRRVGFMAGRSLDPTHNSLKRLIVAGRVEYYQDKRRHGYRLVQPKVQPERKPKSAHVIRLRSWDKPFILAGECCRLGCTEPRASSRKNAKYCVTHRTENQARWTNRARCVSSGCTRRRVAGSAYCRGHGGS